MLTKREAATIVAALLYCQSRWAHVCMTVKLSASLGCEVPLSSTEIDALVVRLIHGEGQEKPE